AKLRAAALRALDPRRQNLFRRMPVPGVSSLTRKKCDHRAVRCLIVQECMAGFTLEHSDGHAPDALPRNAPVRTRGDHVGDALLAPRRSQTTFLISSSERLRSVP